MGKPGVILATGFAPAMRRLQARSYTQLLRLRPLELLKFRQIVRPFLVVATMALKGSEDQSLMEKRSDGTEEQQNRN